MFADIGKSASAIVLIGWLSLAASAVPAVEPESKWSAPEEVVFTARHDATEQRYVLMRPKSFDRTKHHHILVALHGHGSDRWQFVKDNRDECRAARDAAAQQGFLFVAPDYRAKTSWMGPAATEDLRQILQDLRKSYRIDKVVISGGSMGGTSAVAFAAMHPDLCDGVVSLNGTANMLEYDQFADAITTSYGGTKSEKPDVYRQRSAEFFPDRFTMPAAFTTGGKDTLVPPDSTLRLVKQLEVIKAPVHSIHRPDGGHDTNYDDSRTAYDFVMQRVLNRPKLPPPMIDLLAKPVKIVCLGDSVTGIYYHTGGRRAYPELLESALKKVVLAANVSVVNAGISGQTTTNGLERLDRDVLSHQPDIVTISFGLNDVTRLSPEQFRENLEQLIARCRDRKAAVVLCTPNAVIDTAARPIERLNVFCDIIRAVGREQNIRVCDQYRAGEIHRQRDPWGWRLTLSDEIHPNGDGHRRMAEELCQTIAGKHVSLDDLGPPRPALPRLRKLLQAKQPIRVLAMPPYDAGVQDALKSLAVDATIHVTPWPIAGKTLAEIEQDANKLVRAMKPDLVLLTIPREAVAPSDEQFIRSTSWIMNWSLSFGLQEWDVVAIHPAVAEPATTFPRDDLIRQLVHAQDIDLIDRAVGDTHTGTAVLTDWFRTQLRN